MKYLMIFENYEMIKKHYRFNNMVVKIKSINYWSGTEYRVVYEYIEDGKKVKSSVTLTNDEIEDRFIKTKEKLPKVFKGR